MNCPCLGIPITNDEHRGPDNVHGAFNEIARIMDVDLSNGLYVGLSTLAPHDYLEKSHPGMYAVWCQIELGAAKAVK